MASNPLAFAGGPRVGPNRNRPALLRILSVNAGRADARFFIAPALKAYIKEELADVPGIDDTSCWGEICIAVGGMLSCGKAASDIIAVVDEDIAAAIDRHKTPIGL